MKYSKCNFKVEEDFNTWTRITGYDIPSPFYHLTPNGNLLTRYGYTWDGASGAIDTLSIIKASCDHDQKCEMINAKLLPLRFQKIADEELVEEMEKYWIWCRKNACLKKKIKEHLLRPFIWLRRKWVYRAVRIYQEHKRSAPQKVIYEVP